MKRYDAKGNREGGETAALEGAWKEGKGDGENVRYWMGRQTRREGEERHERKEGGREEELWLCRAS